MNRSLIAFGYLWSPLRGEINDADSMGCVMKDSETMKIQFYAWVTWGICALFVFYQFLFSFNIKGTESGKISFHSCSKIEGILEMF